VPTETVPAAPQATPDAITSQANVATNTASELLASEPATAPASQVTAQETVTNAPSASLPAKEIPPPDFRLSGIIYSVGRPSAIVNGETVYVGDEVNGATIIKIRQTTVTLRINGQSKTYTLR
jgi:hypothetical protein